jgi:hypothetical protein
MADTEAAALRDALAAISAALGSPGKDATAEDRAAWREMVPVRAILVAGVAEAILAGNAPIADHVRYLREEIRGWTAAGGTVAEPEESKDD